MTVQETISLGVSIPLPALSPQRKQFLEAPEGLEEEPLNRYAPKILKAREVFLQRVEKPLLRAALRDVISNNIARRTLKITIVFGVLTMIYYLNSLVPAFQTAGAAVQKLELQSKSDDGSSQGLAFGFLQECANRKVSTLAVDNTWSASYWYTDAKAMARR